MLPTALVADHRSIASVHCSATSYWARPWSAHTSSQYTTPVDSGSKPPDTAATPAWSRSARPRGTSPSRMNSRASATRPIAAAAGSRREPTSMACRAQCRAAARSPVSIRSYARTTPNHACTRVSATPSRSRSARANQPRTGAIRAVSNSRCMATRTAASAAASSSPTRMNAAWLRSHASIVTSRWPAAYAISASTGRSDGAMRPSASACIEEVERLLPVTPRRCGTSALDQGTARVLAHRTPPQPWPVDAPLARRRP